MSQVPPGRERRSFKKRRSFSPEQVQDCTYQEIIDEDRVGPEAAKYLEEQLPPDRVVKLDNQREGAWRRRFAVVVGLHPEARDICQRLGITLDRYLELLNRFEVATGKPADYLSEFQRFAVQCWEWDHHEFREPVAAWIDITPRFEAVPAVYRAIFRKKPKLKLLERRPDVIDGGWIEDPESGHLVLVTWTSRLRKQVWRDDAFEDSDHLTIRQYFKRIARKIGGLGPDFSDWVSIWGFREDFRDYRRHTKRIPVRCDDGVIRRKTKEVAYAANRGRSLELTPALLAHVYVLVPRRILDGVSNLKGDLKENLKEYDKVIAGLSNVDDKWTDKKGATEKTVFGGGNFAANTPNKIWKIPGLTKAIGVFHGSRREAARDTHLFGYHLPLAWRGWAAEQLRYRPSPYARKYVEGPANANRLKRQQLRQLSENIRETLRGGDPHLSRVAIVLVVLSAAPSIDLRAAA
jgi:hypothetical protein